MKFIRARKQQNHNRLHTTYHKKHQLAKSPFDDL